MKLAVILIFLCATMLGLATFVESWYGTPAVQFGMYGTWWFGLLNALLALNIFCAAAIRFPWKRYQTGFVITHIGLLTLLFGCLLSRKGGIDAQMPIYEGHMASRAFEDTYHVELDVEQDNVTGRDVSIPPIPLRLGTFNWQDYSEKLPIFPWRFVDRHNAGDVLYDSDGIRLEILDYYSDSKVVNAPYLLLKLRTATVKDLGGSPNEKLLKDQEFPVELSVQETAERYSSQYPLGIGQQERTGGGSLAFWLAGNSAETNAFLASLPQGDLGKSGQVVIVVDGAAYRFNVDSQPTGERFAVEDSAWEVQINESGSSQGGQHVNLTVYSPDETASELLLYADLPTLNQYDRKNGVYGSFWFDHGTKSSQELLQGEGSSRIDIIQGRDEANSPKLYYRYWNRKEVIAAGELPSDGSSIAAFEMPMAKLEMAVDKFIAGDKPGQATLPKLFSRQMQSGMKRPAAKFRLTVDGHEEEFWISGFFAAPGANPNSLEMKTVAGNDRRVTLVMPSDYVDIGFQVKLHKFERQLDPGTDQPSHYSSRVGFLEESEEQAYLAEDVFITMNAPVDFASPKNGRSYRLFQESYNGPFSPTSAEYRNAATDTGRDELYVSILTVNYDPGRGIKYAGCILIVGGIATMFYMKAYFFKPRARKSQSTMRAAPKAKAETRQVEQPVGS